MRNIIWIVMWSCLCLLAGSASAAPLAVTEVAPGVFLHQGVHEEFGEDYHGDIANIGFVVGRDAIAVIDTGGSFLVGSALREAIRLHSALPIRYVINTHVHADHILGNAAFEQDDPVFIGHAQLARAMRLREESYLQNVQTMLGVLAAGTRMVPPSRAIIAAETLELDLGDRELVLRAWPAAHTDHDLTVIDTTSGTAWLGDLLFVERTPSIDGDVSGWLAALAELPALPATRFIPGHGPVVRDVHGAAENMTRYLRLLMDDLRAGISEGLSMTEATQRAAESESKRWLLFESVNARNAALLYPLLEWE